MDIFFEKIHGAENDFIIMDARKPDFPLREVKKRIPMLCNRRSGIGADGVLFLASSRKADYNMIYHNADGSEASMCGNGARCLARFAERLGFPSKVRFHAGGLLYSAEIEKESISIRFPMKPKPEPLVIDGEKWVVVQTGTEHVVRISAEHAGGDYEMMLRRGREVRYNQEIFPTGTNVNFAYVIDDDTVGLTTYERGVENLTRACGTGAIATAIARHYLETESGKQPAGTGSRQIRVLCPGGEIQVSCDIRHDRKSTSYKNIILHGPAVFVFRGSFPL